MNNSTLSIVNAHNSLYSQSGCCNDPRGDSWTADAGPETLPPGSGILSQHKEESALSHDEKNHISGVSRKFLNIIISTMYNTLCAMPQLLYMFGLAPNIFFTIFVKDCCIIIKKY